MSDIYPPAQDSCVVFCLFDHCGFPAGSDAVRIRNCWRDLVVFDAKYFQPNAGSTKIPPTAGIEGPGNFMAPHKFRDGDDLYWNASECCPINADIQSPGPSKAGIYMNPCVCAAYIGSFCLGLDLLGGSRSYILVFTMLRTRLLACLRTIWAS